MIGFLLIMETNQKNIDYLEKEVSSYYDDYLKSKKKLNEMKLEFFEDQLEKNEEIINKIVFKTHSTIEESYSIVNEFGHKYQYNYLDFLKFMQEEGFKSLIAIIETMSDNRVMVNREIRLLKI